jgi:hypothetical protein
LTAKRTPRLAADRNHLPKPFWAAHEAFSGEPRSRPEIKPRYQKTAIKQRGSVMWAFIINLIYDQSCSKYLADVARHQHRWI